MAVVLAAIMPYLSLQRAYFGQLHNKEDHTDIFLPPKEPLKKTKKSRPFIATDHSLHRRLYGGEGLSRRLVIT